MIKQPWQEVKVNRKVDLNSEPIRTDGWERDGDCDNDNHDATESNGATVHFRDLDKALVGYINEAGMVVGCVAWLTNLAILKAIATRPWGASIVVQKEDFLRPDAYDTRSWKATLRAAYSGIKCGIGRDHGPQPLPSLSFACDPTIEGVRCMGMYSGSKTPDVPRMHNKFLVFCRPSVETATLTAGPDEWGMDRSEEYPEEIEYIELNPYAVWTGSFNFTANATISLENAVMIRDDKIAGAYLQEWVRILALSEPLDWQHEYVDPEWRIGT